MFVPGILHRDEMRRFAQSINYDSNHIIALRSPRYPTHKIHKYRFPLSLRYRQRVKQTWGWQWSILTFWHVKHLATKLATSFFIPCHQNVLLRSCYSLSVPGCMEKHELCASLKIRVRKSGSLGTHHLSSYRKLPSSWMWVRYFNHSS